MNEHVHGDTGTALAALSSSALCTPTGVPVSTAVSTGVHTHTHRQSFADSAFAH